MLPPEIGFAAIGLILLLMALRVPIGVALLLVSFGGVYALRGATPAFGLLKTLPFSFATNWDLSAIPMFLLMGTIAHKAGLSSAFFRVARLWLYWLPGGLAVAANFACAGFSAATGSSVATAAAMGRIAIPVMIRYRYDHGLATGTVAAAGTLGSLIPPSVLFVLFGIYAEVSISQLFMAGLLPGVLTALMFAGLIVLRCSLNPLLAPPVDEQPSARERWQAVGEIWPVTLLIFAVIGGLYFGVVTPTEAGAFGAAVATVIAVFQRGLDTRGFLESVWDSVYTTGRIFFIALGAAVFARFLALTGVQAELGEFISAWGVTPLMLIFVVCLVYLILGTFMEAIGVLLITLPILLPLFHGAGLELIWVAVILVKMLEVGLMTPPLGLNVYVIKATVGDAVPLGTIFWGVTWFLGCEVVIIAILIWFPEISLALPRLMRDG